MIWHYVDDFFFLFLFIFSYRKWNKAAHKTGSNKKINNNKKTFDSNKLHNEIKTILISYKK